MTSGIVRLESDEVPGVRVLTLNDPDRRNAFGQRMMTDLTEAVTRVAADQEVRALVVTGAGPAFCAGADLPAMFGLTERPVAEIRAELRKVYDSFLRVGDLAMPTVAAVNGPAVGAGLNLALCCDVRIAGPEASFGATFTRLGLHPGGGSTYFLVRTLGARWNPISSATSSKRSGWRPTPTCPRWSSLSHGHRLPPLPGRRFVPRWRDFAGRAMRPDRPAAAGAGATTIRIRCWRPS